jgi:hypothetical protein
MTIYKDFLGQELKEGDRVITYETGGYTGLRWATVVAFTPKMVRIRFGKKGKYESDTTTRYGQDLVVMGEEQEQMLTAMILKT